MGYLRPTLTIAAIMFFAGSSALADPGNTEESDLAAIYGDSDFVSIATGTSQPIASPSIRKF